MGGSTANTADGLRLSVADEFSSIYVYNLRGNQRAADWRAEGGKVFGEGSQTTVAIIVAIKSATSLGRRKINYFAVADSQTREQKLDALAVGSIGDSSWQELSPNADGD